MKKYLLLYLIPFYFISCGKTEYWADIDSFISKIKQNVKTFPKVIKEKTKSRNPFHISTSMFTRDINLEYREYEDSILVTSDPDDVFTEEEGFEDIEKTGWRGSYNLYCKKVANTTLTIKYRLQEIETGREETITVKIDVECEEGEEDPT